MNQSHQNSASGKARVGTDAFVRPLTQSSTASKNHVGTAAPGCPVEQSSTAAVGNRNNRRVLSTLLLMFALAAPQGFGQGMSKGIMSPPANVRPPYLENVGIEQHLDAQVPADLAFTDDSGRAVKLGDYFGKKPLILNLVYYNCTMLCGEALSGLSGSMKMIKFDAGNEYDVITVSFDPRETPQIAAEKKQEYLKRYGRPGAATRLAFSDRLRRFDQRADQGRRFPVSVRSEKQSVRARHGDHGADARRPHLALLLRCGLSAERSAHGTGRGLAKQDRQRRRSGAARTAITTTPPPENTARS